MNIKLKNKKIAVLLFCAVIVLPFFGCQTIEETINPTNLYDYGARQFNPAIAKFLTVEPQVEKYSIISPYAYCTNNSIRLIDPTGMAIDSLSQTKWDTLKQVIIEQRNKNKE